MAATAPATAPVTAAVTEYVQISPPDRLYYTLPEVFKTFNDHAGPQGYAVVKARTKESKKGVLRKCVFRCDRGGKAKDSGGTGKRFHSSSRLIDCPYSVVALLQEDHWHLNVRNPHHNHPPTMRGSHPVLRKMAMTDEAKQIIIDQSRNQATPATILSTLRMNDDQEDPVFKNRDLYNFRASIKKKALGPFTPVQALMRMLRNNDEWYLRHKRDAADQITHLFFSKTSSQTMLKSNYEVLLMDCTYKTNKYRLPLLIVCGVTALNTTFYIAFCFLISEHTDDYAWMLRQLRGLYQTLDISPPNVIVTDREKALISALEVVNPGTTHVLCLWHIQKNVLKNCKPQFATEEEWICFQQMFNEIIYSSSLNDFENAWNKLQNTYRPSHIEAAGYVFSEWYDYRQKYVKYWTNQLTHFNNNTTSRVEIGHRTLKRSLRFSTGRSKVA